MNFFFFFFPLQLLYRHKTLISFLSPLNALSAAHWSLTHKCCLFLGEKEGMFSVKLPLSTKLSLSLFQYLKKLLLPFFFFFVCEGEEWWPFLLTDLIFKHFLDLWIMIDLLCHKTSLYAERVENIWKCQWIMRALAAFIENILFFC